VAASVALALSTWAGSALAAPGLFIDPGDVTFGESNTFGSEIAT